MKYFRKDVKTRTATLYPFVCWHLGAEQSDIEFIKETVARVKDDPNGFWFYMGDAGECVTRMSKGDIHKQTKDLTAQANEFAELTLPIRKKGLFGIKGNHGNRVYKETGLEFDDVLCEKAKIPYLGVSAFWQLALGKVVWKIFSHHGLDSGATISSKVNKATQLEGLVDADTVFSAHSHVCMELQPKHTAIVTDTGTRWRTTRQYICGCAYDSRTGYAEDKGYSPILPAHLAVTFSIVNGRKNQSCKIWRRDTDED